MHTTHERDQLAPPHEPARLRAVVLAVLAHLVLLAALTWGVNWKSSSDQPAMQAELWSAAPQQAAPRAQPPPEPEPQPVSPPPPPPAPTRAPPPPPPPPPRQAEPDTREADIAIEREKKKRLEEQKAQQQKLEQLKRDKERKEDERRDRLEVEKKKERLQKERQDKAEQQKAERDKAEREKAEREKERLEKIEKQQKQQQQQQAEDKKRQAAQDKAKQDALEKASAAASEERRQATLRRLQGLAGASGGDNANGSAKQDSGPSGSYGGKVAAKVKPNIVYPDAINGNPRAVVQVRAAPDGTIVGKKLVQSSGNKSWDDAVLRALDKTETLPRDVDGRVPASLEIGFRPQD